MTSAELDRLWQRAARKIVSAEITRAPDPVPGRPDQSRVLATFDDGSRVELFSFTAHDRSFAPNGFIGLTLEGARELKFERSQAQPAAAR